MAEIVIGPLSDRLGDDEIAEIVRALKKAGAPQLPSPEDEVSATVAKGVDDDVLAEFLDRLEANDIACDIYLPIEFDGTVEAADVRVGSVSVLLDVLEELKEELSIDADEDEDEDADADADEDEDEDDLDADEDEDEEASELELVERQLQQVWRYFFAGASAAMNRSLPLYLTVR